MNAVTLPSLSLPCGCRAATPDDSGSPTRTRVGDVEDVILVDPHAARPAELCRLGNELPFLIENLDTVVPAIADDEAPLESQGQGVRLIELARPGPFFPIVLISLPSFENFRIRLLPPPCPSDTEDVASGATTTSFG